ncbi:COMM domain [Phytophthora cactorum]|nr:COMM domain [Phytophthora cactorum]
MAGGFAGDAAAFLDSDAPVVPRHALEHLSTLSAASLEALVSAAARELTGVSCTSHNTAEQQIPTAALRSGVEDEDLQMKLMPVLSAVVPSVERVLENTSFDFAHVVDVSWRLDYVLRSSSAGSVHEPLYFVQLKLQSPHISDSKLQTVTFSCTVEELRSLVYRIQEAANEVEKLAAGTPSQLRTNA